MPLTPARITEITTDVIKLSFFNYFLGREETETKHAVLAAFFPAESVIGSAIVGIATSLGSFWEKLASTIASENGFQVLNPKTDFFQPTHIPTQISALITNHHQRRMVANANIKMGEFVADLQTLISSLNIPSNSSFQTLEKGSGLDLLLQKNNTLYAYDLKTVQMNASGGGLYSERIMKWTAYDAIYQKSKGVNHLFNGHIVIPYDPHAQSNWWDHFAGRVYPLDKSDLKLCNDFWDFMSGVENSFQYIKIAIDNLVNQGFPMIYHPSLYTADAQRSFEILNAACNLRNTVPDIAPKTFVEVIDWECLNCHHQFKKSIRWFEKNRICPSCNANFLK